MSNLRLAIILLLGIVALGVTDWWLVRRGIGEDRRNSPAVTLVPQSMETASAVLTRPNGVSVRLEKRASWCIAAPFRAEADPEVVMKFLDAIAFAAVRDAMSKADLAAQGKALSDFGLAHPVLTVELGDSRETRRLEFGSLTPEGTGIYVALSDGDRVVVAPSELLSAVDLTADQLRRRELLTAAVETIAAFDLRQGAKGVLAFERSGGNWQVGADMANAQKVRELLEAVTAAKVRRFVWPNEQEQKKAEAPSESLLAGYGLDPESAVILTVRFCNGEERQISFGRKSDRGGVYAYLRNSGTIVEVEEQLGAMVAESTDTFVDSRLWSEPVQAIAQISIGGTNGVCALRREADGHWRLESPIAAPAASKEVEALLKRIAELRTQDRDERGIAISFSTNQAPIKVRAGAILGDGGLAALRSLEILKVEPMHFKRLVRTMEGNSASAESVSYSAERKAWNVDKAAEGAKVDDAGVAAVAASLSPLRAVRVEKLKIPATELEAYGLSTPWLTLAIDQDQADSVRRNLLVGAVAPGGGRYATVGSADALFILSEATVEALAKPLLRK